MIDLEKKVVLIVEDDPDDIYLISEAIDESQLEVQVFIVEDGLELMDYLYHRGRFADEALSPRPDLILLDLNMPKKDGREALAELKADPSLKAIQVVVLTTSNADEDKETTYELGSSGFVTKPASFRSLKETITKIGSYWLTTVDLPDENDQDDGGK